MLFWSWLSEEATLITCTGDRMCHSAAVSERTTSCATGPANNVEHGPLFTYSSIFFETFFLRHGLAYFTISCALLDLSMWVFSKKQACPGWPIVSLHSLSLNRDAAPRNADGGQEVRQSNKVSLCRCFALLNRSHRETEISCWLLVTKGGKVQEADPKNTGINCLSVVYLWSGCSAVCTNFLLIFLL